MAGWSLAPLLVVAAGCAGSRAAAPAAGGSAAPAACIADELPRLRNDADLDPPCGSGPACGEACLAGDAVACYVRGVEIEDQNRPVSESQDLYRRACRGGVAIGCTNFGASLWAHSQGANPCARRLFQLSCAVDEAWGCGMQGRLLIDDATPDCEGKSCTPRERTPTEREQVQRGHEILERSCQKLGKFPCRALALELESGALGKPDKAAIRKALARACETGDDDACGHVDAGSTFKTVP